MRRRTISRGTMCSAIARDYELVVIHTSAPTLARRWGTRGGAEIAEPGCAGGAGRRARGGAAGGDAARSARRWIGWGARSSTSPAAMSPLGLPLAEIDGLSFRREGQIVHNPERALIGSFDELPSVMDVYARDLEIENYFIGYLKHPYVSHYTGRGCPAQCTFCLWPQTVGGHKYRARSPEGVAREMAHAQRALPAGEGVLFRRRHFHRVRSRAPARSRSSSASWGSPGAAMRGRMSTTRR